MVWKTSDSKGNDYTKVGGNDDTKAIICLDGVNKLMKGKVNISLRKGNASKFGQEIVIQFKVEGIEETYNASSPWSHIEFYLPEEIGKKYSGALSGIISKKNCCEKCFESRKSPARTNHERRI